jgi:hypothetical protein
LSNSLPEIVIAIDIDPDSERHSKTISLARAPIGGFAGLDNTENTLATWI